MTRRSASSSDAGVLCFIGAFFILSALASVVIWLFTIK